MVAVDGDAERKREDGKEKKIVFVVCVCVSSIRCLIGWKRKK